MKQYWTNWKAWLIVGVYVWFVLWDFQRIDSQSHSVSDTLLNFIPDTIILTAILIFIYFRMRKK